MYRSRIIEERKLTVQNAEKESFENEKIREQSLELEKLKLHVEQEKVKNQNVNTKVSQTRLAMSHNTKSNIMNQTAQFNPRVDDINLYLVNFERRAEIAQIPKNEWVAYLLGLLPSEMSKQIAHESYENFLNYDYIKNILLKRFNLNPEKLRQLFYTH